ncbi:hypothetical protein D3C72_1586960 [compost metagenome]
MVAAAEVQPLHPAQQGGELRLHRRPDAGQGLEVLFAQGVDMQAVDALHVLRSKLRHREAQARAGLGRVVFGDLALGMFGVQPQADLEDLALGPRLGDQVGEARHLIRRVEDDVVGQAQDLGQILGLVGGRIGGQLALVELTRQPRLPQTGGADAVEVFPDDVRQRPHGKGLERQQDPGIAPVTHVLEHGQIAPHRDLVHHEGGRGDAVQIKVSKGSGIAGLGFHVVFLLRSLEGEHFRTREARPALPRSTAGHACSACP